jgi:hypothetical protein
VTALEANFRWRTVTVAICGLILAAEPVYAATKVALEAESASRKAGSGVVVIPDDGASAGRAILLSADKHADYTVDLPESGSWQIWLRGRSGSSHLEPATLDVTFDGQPVARIADGKGFGQTWRWSARNSRQMPIAKVKADRKGKHDLTLRVRDGSVAIDQIVLMRDADTRPGTPVTLSAFGFVDSVGVNVHLNYRNTAYGDFDRVQKALDYLGVHHVRDVITKNPDQLARIDALMTKGYDFNFMIPPDLGTIDEQIARMRPRAEHIASIEGPNEDDITEFHIYNGKRFPDGTRMMQTDLFNKVKADPVLGRTGRNIPVIAPSLARGSSYAKLGDLSDVSDYGNTHSYFGSGDPPGKSRFSNFAEGQTTAKGRAMIATEGGYHTAQAIKTGHLGVTPEVHGKYMTRFLLDQYRYGWKRTYVYELLDMKDDPGKADRGKNWGLFFADGTPKPAARGIANIIALLKDQGAPAHPGTLDYALKGLPADADELLFQKRDGKFYLVIWSDTKNWDEWSARGITSADQPVTLSLASAANSVTLFRPLTDGTKPVSTLSKVSEIDFSLPDHPVIIEITPG